MCAPLTEFARWGAFTALPGSSLSAGAARMTRSGLRRLSMLCSLSRAGSLNKPMAASGGAPSAPPPAAGGSQPVAIPTQRTASLEVGLSTVSISGGAIPPSSRGTGAPTPADVRQPGLNLVMTAMAAANAAHAAANGGPAAGAAPQEAQEPTAAPAASAAVLAAQPAATMSRAASPLDEPQEPLFLGTNSAAQAGPREGEQQQQQRQQDAAAPRGLADQAASPAATSTGEQPAAVQAGPAAARGGPGVAPGLGQAAEGVAQLGAGPAGDAQAQPSADGVAAGSQAVAAPAAGQGLPLTAGATQAAPAAGAAAAAAAVALPPARAAPPPLPPLEKGDMLEAFRCCADPCTRRRDASGPCSSAILPSLHRHGM